jgi:hypothetical protein
MYFLHLSKVPEGHLAVHHVADVHQPLLPIEQHPGYRELYVPRVNPYKNPYQSARYRGRRPRPLTFPVSVAVPNQYIYDVPIKHLNLKQV